MDDRRWPGDPDQHSPPEQGTGEWLVAEPDRPAATGWAWRTDGRAPREPARWSDDRSFEQPWDSAHPYRSERGDWAADAPSADLTAGARPSHRPPPGRRPTARGGAYGDVPAGDGDEELRPRVGSALLWTVATFVLPLLAYLGWVWSLSTPPRPGCVDASGAPCPGPRAQAVASLAEALPALAVALGLALLLAVLIRRIAFTWRGYKVGFAAGVIAAGLVTLGTAALG